MQASVIADWGAPGWNVPGVRTPHADAQTSAPPTETMTSPIETFDASDAELFSRIRTGDAEAFAAFYDRHAGLLFGVALKIMGHGHDAEDVLQDAAVLIWERAPTFDPALGQPVHWAVTLTRNKAIDRLRSRRRRGELADEVAQEPAVEPALESTAVRLTSLAEEAQSIHQAMATLPPDQRQAIELAFFQGMTQQDIATRLDQPLGTIKARIRRGMLALRSLLETDS